MKETSHSFRKRVMEYYRTNGRHHLPWRKTRDPYKILVSETMLQQTQVDRVIPYFKKWMKTFPTVKALANAPLSEVLKEWQGLGYNRRGKLLRECAKKIVEKHGGKVPQDFAALVDLPAIGPYTAGAIRAFAFDEHEVFIETNIRAALIHYFFPRSKKVPDSRLMPILEELLKGVTSPREWYSALMDYGVSIKKTNPNPSRRSMHHLTQAAFEGSLRQMRGEVLRRLTRHVSLEPARRQDPERFEKACIGLIADGLAERHGRTIRLVQ
ncbi:MAG: A/G-specific adenine glycosylase [Minisyncoccia bacterium]